MSARYNNAKLYWQMLKECSYKKDPKEISLESFTEYFKAINNPDNRFFHADEDVIDFTNLIFDNEVKIMFNELDLPFTMEEILQVIVDLNLGRSAGPDGIINEFLVYGKDILALHILKVFNKILEKGYFSASWSEGYIIPIHKKGSLDNVSNFRGMTLLSVVVK